MEREGNFVLYNGIHMAAWETATGGHPGSKLVVHDDATIVISDSSDTPLWGSNPLLTPEQQREIAELRAEPIRIDTGLLWVAGSGFAQKKMRTHGYLYSNGFLTVQFDCQNRHPTSGLRPRAVIVVYAEDASSIWVSEVLAGKTFCALGDITCGSSGTTSAITQNFPLAIGQYAVGADVFQFDGDQSATFRRNMCIAVREGAEWLPDKLQGVGQAILDMLRC